MRKKIKKKKIKYKSKKFFYFEDYLETTQKK